MKTLTSKQVRLLSLTAVAIGVGALFSTSSQAAAADQETSSVTVHYGDLNLSRPKDVDTLYIRLHNSAKQVCGDDESAIDLWKLDHVSRCEQQAIENAVAKIDRPKLTALYDERYPYAALVPVAMRLPQYASTLTLGLVTISSETEMPS